MQPSPRAPDLVWSGQLHGTGCLSARALDTGFPTVVWCLCLGPGCGWVWVSITQPVLAGVLGGCVWVRSVASSLICRLGFVVVVIGLGFRPAAHLSWLGISNARGCVRAPPAPRRFRFGCVVWACVLGSGFRLRPATPWGGVRVCVCSCALPCGLLHLLVGGAVQGCVLVRAPCLFPAFPGWGVLCGRACWAGVSAVPRSSWLGCRSVFIFLRVLLWLCGFGRWLSLSRALWSLFPYPLSFGLGCRLFFFSSQRGVCVRVLGVSSPGGPLLQAWCCRFWLGGPPVPLWGSCLRCLLGGGFGRPLWCWREVWWLWAGLSPPPPSPTVFFFRGGLPVPPSAFPGLAHALARILCGLPGYCWQWRSPWGVPAPWVGLVMYTLGSAPLPAGLGPGSAGWVAAPGGFVWLWVRGWGCLCPFSSAVPVLTFWVDRHLCCWARGAPVCGPRCRCVACWCGAFQGVRWLVLVSPSG